MIPPALAPALHSRLGPPSQMAAVNGGGINQALHWQTGSASFFVKWNDTLGAEVFLREAEGLERLAAAGGVDVARVKTYGEAEGVGFLVLHWFDAVRPAAAGWAELGKGLARLHRVSADAYGLAEDNFIGSLPQSNRWDGDWASFWREHRVWPLLRRAAERKLISAALAGQLERLAENAEHFVTGCRRAPSLLHGDLWSGNVSFTNPASPILYDPAVYFGDREVELAFTELFGGFPPLFYEAYQQEFPLEAGYARRRPYWQLYPLLVHVNLFGGAYAAALQRTAGEAERAI
jgi:fructosamine-3-kinase